MSTWKYFAGNPEIKQGVAIIRLDHSAQKMNTLNEGLQEEVERLWMQHVAPHDVKAVVFMSAKPDNFIAGADIGMLKAKKSAGEEDSLEKACLDGHELFARLKKAKNVPFVAAIHGACLGGGLEWALKCDRRIATTSPKTKLGLPEVKLGLLPGWGGMYALPKLIGVTNALPLILQGKELRADKARKLGLVDGVCDLPSLEKLAIQTALEKPKKKKTQYMDLLVRNVPYLRSYVFRKAKEQVDKSTRGKYPAPYEILNCIEAGCTKTEKEANEIEAKAFVRLAKTPTSTGLIGLFDGITEAKKYAPSNHSFDKVCVVGGGLMGAGIAQVTVEKGIDVVLKDVNLAGVQRGVDYVSTNLAKKVKRKRMSDYDRNSAISKISAYYNDEDQGYLRRVRNADVVIEAVLEKLDLKHKVFSAIESVVSEDCVLATNTSAIPIADVARGCSKPERFLGMHYFSPVPQMQLLEIIPHQGTNEKSIERATALGIKQGKTCIAVKDVPGFYVNRALSPMMAELGMLFADGVDPSTLDEAILDLGMPVGPCALLDEVGADVALHVQKTMVADPTMEHRMAGADPKMLQTIVDNGWLGRKSGKGFFEYKGRKKVPHKAALDWVAGLKKDVVPEDLSKEEIQDRFISRFVNECVVCLEQDIIKSPVDGDLGAVFGIGYLPFTGGPFRMLDNVGAQFYVDKMNKLADKYESDRFAPCQLLKDKANSGKKFH